MSDTARHPDLDLSSWAFWRKRLARVLVAGGVAFFAAQFFVNLPRDQHVIFQVPSGHQLHQLSVTYRQAADRETLGGTQFSLPQPTSRASHVFRLPKGKYTFSVAAETTDTNGQVHLLKSAETVDLENGTAHINVSAPPDADR